MPPRKDPETVRIAEDLNSRFMMALHEYRNKNGARSPGYHISQLTGDCLRRMYYDNKIGGNNMDLGGFLKTTYGMMVHEMVELGDEKEFKVSMEVSGLTITGSIDDIIRSEAGIIIVDKKTSRADVRSAYLNHWKQLEFYAAVLRETTDEEADYMAVQYINLGEVGLPNTFVKQVPNLDAVKIELENIVCMLDEFIGLDTLPPKKMYWMCRFCNYVEQCSGDCDK